jgi:hypothetical protein
MSDKHLLRVCWGMCIFCVLALGLSLGYVVSHEFIPDKHSAWMAVSGVVALIGFWVFFSIAHDEPSQ